MGNRWSRPRSMLSIATAYGALGGLMLSFISADAGAEPAVNAGTPSVSASARLGDEQRAELDSYVQSALLAFDVPGAAVAVLQNGEIVYRGAFGVRGDRHPAPVDEQTLFMIGSVTKSVTATMIATLVDDGIIQWDVPVQQYLRSFELAVPEYSELVSLRQLLSHQSGVARSDVSLFLGPERPLELIEDVRTFPLDSPPGQSFQYQNQMYALAGFVAARAAGARYTNHALDGTFERLMQTRVFDAVGMRRTTLDFDRAMQAPNHAWPNEYSALAGSVTAVQPSYERFATTVPGAGAVWSTIDDMARYAQMQIREGRNFAGRRVVSETALQETHTQMTPGSDGGYGLGWGVLNGPGGTIIEHSGGTTGFGCDVLLATDQDWGVVVLTNRASSEFFQQAVERYALEVLFAPERSDDGDLLAAELQHRAAISQLAAVTTPVTAADAQPYAGQYERGVRVIVREPDLIIQTEFGELQARPVPGYPGGFLIVGNVLAGGVAQFATDDAGREVVTIGLLDLEGENVNLLQPITLQRRAPHQHPPRFLPRDPRAEWGRVARHLHQLGVRPSHTRLFR